MAKWLSAGLPAVIGRLVHFLWKGLGVNPQGYLTTPTRFSGDWGTAWRVAASGTPESPVGFLRSHIGRVDRLCEIAAGELERRCRIVQPTSRAFCRRVVIVRVLRSPHLVADRFPAPFRSSAPVSPTGTRLRITGHITAVGPRVVYSNAARHRVHDAQNGTLICGKPPPPDRSGGTRIEGQSPTHTMKKMSPGARPPFLKVGRLGDPETWPPLRVFAGHRPNQLLAALRMGNNQPRLPRHKRSAHKAVADSIRAVLNRLRNVHSAFPTRRESDRQSSAERSQALPPLCPTKSWVDPDAERAGTLNRPRFQGRRG